MKLCIFMNKSKLPNINVWLYINRLFFIQLMYSYACDNLHKLTVLGKLLPETFPPDNSYQENPHLEKLPPRITPTREISTRNVSTQDNYHPENSYPDYFIIENSVEYSFHPNIIQPCKFPLIMFAIKIIPSHQFLTTK